MKRFKKNENWGNEVAKGNGFAISYNPAPGNNTVFSGDRNSDETVLVNHNALYEYLILNGDFRKEYLAVIDNGYDACLEVYDKYRGKLQSSWSSDYSDTRG